MTTFVLATANAHKADEMRAVLSPLGVDLLDRPENVADVDETGATLEENALLKARALVVATGHAAIADDTGLFVDALDGRPGVRSARFAHERATDAENNAALLSALDAGGDAAQEARESGAPPGESGYCAAWASSAVW